MTTLQEAARKALKALEVATTPLAKDRQEVLTAMYDLRTALAQQGEPVAQARLGMKDGLAMALSVVELYGMKGDVIYREIAKLRDGIAAAPAPQAQQGEPVCAGCGIPAGDVHMSTCKSGKWPSRVSNGDTAAPAPQPAQGLPFVAWSKEAEMRESWVAQPVAPDHCEHALDMVAQPRDLTDEEILSLEKQTPAMNDAGEEWIYFARAVLKKARE